MRSFAPRQGLFGDMRGAGRVDMQGVWGGGIAVPGYGVLGYRIIQQDAFEGRGCGDGDRICSGDGGKRGGSYGWGLYGYLPTDLEVIFYFPYIRCSVFLCPAIFSACKRQVGSIWLAS